MNKKNKILIFSIFLFLFGFNFVFAAGKINLEFPIPGMSGGVSGFGEYVRILYDYLIYLSGVLAVIMIMISGFQWVAAGGNPSKISQAKEKMVGAIIGLFLVAGSYLILNIVNPGLTNIKDLNLKPIDAVKLGCCQYTDGGGQQAYNTTQSECVQQKDYKFVPGVEAVTSANVPYCPSTGNVNTNLIASPGACSMQYMSSFKELSSDVVNYFTSARNGDSTALRVFCGKFGGDSNDYCRCQMNWDGSGNQCYYCRVMNPNTNEIDAWCFQDSDDGGGQKTLYNGAESSTGCLNACRDLGYRLGGYSVGRTYDTGGVFKNCCNCSK